MLRAIVAERAMLSFSLPFAVHLILDDRAVQAVLVLFHVGLLAYAITRYIGWRAAVTDPFADIRGTVPTATGVRVRHVTSS